MPDGKVRVNNSYVFLLQNTKKETMKFYFEILTPKGMEGKITIVRPTKAFDAQPEVKKKKIVTLSTIEVLANNAINDTIIPITIHAYALDKDGKKSEKISVLRKSSFIYPKKSVLNSPK